MRDAIRREGGIGYMEPPYWYYPVRQTLGAILLEQGRADDALDAFRAALSQVPRNGWGLWVLWQVMAATESHPGDTAAARAAFDRG